MRREWRALGATGRKLHESPWGQHPHHELRRSGPSVSPLNPERPPAYVMGVLASDTMVPTTKAAATVGMNQPGRTCAPQRPGGDQREQDAEDDAADVSQVRQRPRLFAHRGAVHDREAVGQGRPPGAEDPAQATAVAPSARHEEIAHQT